MQMKVGLLKTIVDAPVLRSLAEPHARTLRVGVTKIWLAGKMLAAMAAEATGVPNANGAATDGLQGKGVLRGRWH